MKPNFKRSGLIYIVILVVAIALFSLLIPPIEKPTEIPLSEAITMTQNNEIDKIVVDDDTLVLTTTDEEELKTAIGNLTIVDLQELGLKLPEGGYEVKSSGGFDWGLMINFALIKGGLVNEMWWWYLPPGLCIILFVYSIVSLGFSFDEHKGDMSDR